MKIVRRTQKQVFKLWIAALRSGKYTQGKERLRTNDGKFCCLGVLCDLAAKDGGAQWNGFEYECSTTTLPDDMFMWMGFLSDSETTLINMNDGGQSFKTIAKFIERELMPMALMRVKP